VNPFNLFPVLAVRFKRKCYRLLIGSSQQNEDQAQDFCLSLAGMRSRVLALALADMSSHLSCSPAVSMALGKIFKF
jgi:hypothetical protein